MKIKHYFAAAVVSATLCATGASAAVLNLSEAVKSGQGGFASSLIHDQADGQMSGNRLARFAPALEGFFNTVTGAIEFAGSMVGGGTYTAEGNLQLSGTRALGVFGFLDFVFSGDVGGGLGGQSIRFNFADETYGPSDEPNGFASVGEKNVVSLWGDNGCFDETARVSDDVEIQACYGIDLRIRHDGRPDGGVIPLPASAFFLLAGIGGLGVTRKLRNKA